MFTGLVATLVDTIDDQISEAGLTSQNGTEEENAVSINESIASFECKVVDEAKVRGHALFVGEVISVETTEEFFDTEKSMWKTEKVNLIYHMVHNFFTTNERTTLSL
jgi:flavin reductase (DIM6/NTAB) family NADH-FMN oxidoreductase RutF